MIADTLMIARRELRDAMRSRWLWLYTLAFVLLGRALEARAREVLE